MVKLERKNKNIIPNFNRADVQLLEILEDSGEESVVKNVQITKFVHSNLYKKVDRA